MNTAGSAGREPEGFAASSWGCGAWNREPGPAHPSPVLRCKPRRLRSLKTMESGMGTGDFKALTQQLPLPPTPPISTRLQRSPQKTPSPRPSTGHLPPRPFPLAPAAGRQGSVVKPGPGNFTRGNSRGALRRRRLSVSLGCKAAAAAKEAAAVAEKEQQWRRGPVRGEPRGRDRKGQQ